MPQPSIYHPDPMEAFLSALLEEFGDEWGNKWMFHYRWARDVDQISAAGRIARASAPRASEEQYEALREQIRTRMVGRVGLRGLERADRAADRGVVPRDDRYPRRAPRHSALPVRSAARVRRLRAVGPDLQRVDRSDAGRVDRGPRAQRAHLGAAHALPARRGRLRGLVESRADAGAAARTPGRATLPALERRERGRDRGGQGGVQRRSRGLRVDAEAAEVPREVARGAARALPTPCATTSCSTMCSSARAACSG